MGDEPNVSGFDLEHYRNYLRILRGSSLCPACGGSSTRPTSCSRPS